MTCRVGDGQIRPKYAQRPQTQVWLQIETPDTVDRLLVDWVSGTD